MLLKGCVTDCFSIEFSSNWNIFVNIEMEIISQYSRSVQNSRNASTNLDTNFGTRSV